MARDGEDRVAEYVNSPRMRRRLKSGESVYCTIDGHSGTYLVRAALDDATDAACTCPLESPVCKHIEALRRTYRVRPRSFFDLEGKLAKLAEGPPRRRSWDG